MILAEQADATTTLSAGQVFVASLPALIALVGVLIASVWNAKTTLRAEDHRASAALEAEDRRAEAAIEAEDVRGRNAIKAEDRRHEHSIALERQRITTASRHDLYVQIEAARRDLDRAAGNFTFFLSEDPDDYWYSQAQDYIAALDTAIDKIGELEAEASLYGSSKVGEACSSTWSMGYTLLVTSQDFLNGEEGVSRDAVHKQALVVADRCKALLTAMRSELGSD